MDEDWHVKNFQPPFRVEQNSAQPGDSREGQIMKTVFFLIQQNFHLYFRCEDVIVKMAQNNPHNPRRTYQKKLCKLCKLKWFFTFCAYNKRTDFSVKYIKEAPLTGEFVTILRYFSTKRTHLTFDIVSCRGAHRLCVLQEFLDPHTGPMYPGPSVCLSVSPSVRLSATKVLILIPIFRNKLACSKCRKVTKLDFRRKILNFFYKQFYVKK